VIRRPAPIVPSEHALRLEAGDPWRLARNALAGVAFAAVVWLGVWLIMVLE
jgi:hypothetical protein